MNTVRKLKLVRLGTKAIPLLKVLAGGTTPNDHDRCVDYFWSFCHAAIWNHRLFTPTEINHFKTLIQDYFKHSKNVHLTFRQLVEMVCLAKRFSSLTQDSTASPEDWLNMSYPNGLAGTLHWYQQRKRERKAIPRNSEGIRLLSLAVFHACYHPHPKDLEHYRKKFILHKEYDLLQMYMNTLLHLGLS